MTTNTKAQHTPTPWHIVRNPKNLWPQCIYSKKGVLTAEGANGHISNENDPVTLANTAFIVRAVNAHEVLVSCALLALAYMHDEYAGESIDLEKALIGAIKLARSAD